MPQLPDERRGLRLPEATLRVETAVNNDPHHEAEHGCDPWLLEVG